MVKRVLQQRTPSAAALVPLALALWTRGAHAQSAVSAGCFSLAATPVTASVLWSAIPSDCLKRCSSALPVALLAPLPSDSWTFNCACVAALPASLSTECNLSCPGAPDPASAPLCGGGGYDGSGPMTSAPVVWSAYTYAGAVAGEPAPIPANSVAQQSADPVVLTSSEAVAPVATSTSAPAAASVADTILPESASSAHSIDTQLSLPASSPSFLSSPPVHSVVPASSSAVVSASPFVKGPGLNPVEPDATTTSSSPHDAANTWQMGLLVAGSVVLAVGFAIAVQRRRRQAISSAPLPLFNGKPDYFPDTYHDKRTLLRRVNSFDSTLSSSYSFASLKMPALPPLALLDRKHTTAAITAFSPDHGLATTLGGDGAITLFTPHMASPATRTGALWGSPVKDNLLAAISMPVSTGAAAAPAPKLGAMPSLLKAHLVAGSPPPPPPPPSASSSLDSVASRIHRLKYGRYSVGLGSGTTRSLPEGEAGESVRSNQSSVFMRGFAKNALMEEGLDSQIVRKYALS
ncbi:hypothetical protein BC830DRAFT_1172737 [Chytriomyces sp. MP71]|nr:hypothetical protein BC830DRAFT_1172737 [Chytriomyces sp. MP71]